MSGNLPGMYKPLDSIPNNTRICLEGCHRVHRNISYFIKHLSELKTQTSTVQNTERDERKTGVGEGRGEGGGGGRESTIRNLFAALLLEATQRFGVWVV